MLVLNLLKSIGGYLIKNYNNDEAVYERPGLRGKKKERREECVVVLVVRWLERQRLMIAAPKVRYVGLGLYFIRAKEQQVTCSTTNHVPFNKPAQAQNEVTNTDPSDSKPIHASPYLPSKAIPLVVH